VAENGEILVALICLTTRVTDCGREVALAKHEVTGVVCESRCKGLAVLIKCTHLSLMRVGSSELQKKCAV
jgi:hypothetical protein